MTEKVSSETCLQLYMYSHDCQLTPIADAMLFDKEDVHDMEYVDDDDDGYLLQCKCSTVSV